MNGRTHSNRSNQTPEDVLLCTNALLFRRVSGESKMARMNFISLRKRLDILGYQSYPLGRESEALVRKLVEDVVIATESLRDSERRLKSVEGKVFETEALLEPYIEENTRISRENRQLHERILQLEEKIASSGIQHESELFEVKADNRRLSLFNRKAKEIIQGILRENDAIKLKLERIEMRPDHMSVPRSQVLIEECKQTTKSVVELRAADKDRKEIKRLKKKIEEMEVTLGIRDSEICRLNKELASLSGSNAKTLELKYRLLKME